MQQLPCPILYSRLLYDKHERVNWCYKQRSCKRRHLVFTKPTQPSTNECQDMESMTRCFSNFGYGIAFKILIIILRYISSTKEKVNISMTRGHRKLLFWWLRLLNQIHLPRSQKPSWPTDHLRGHGLFTMYLIGQFAIFNHAFL